MIEITREQVDITALGPNSYLWLKNKAKIHILIRTPCVGKLDCKTGNRIERSALGDTEIGGKKNPSSDLISLVCK